MQSNTIKRDDEFQKIDTRTIDDRNRLTIGSLFKGNKRIRLYMNNGGEVLLQPMVEIPASETWLLKNKEAKNHA